jgi:uncharacterized protein (TIGR02265 family)
MPSDFVAPDWDAPLDVAAYVESIPHGAGIKGMYPAAVVDAARSRGLALPSARERYLSFQDVPLREYAGLLVEATRAFHPTATLRTGLRRVGRQTHDVFARSVIGRVVLSTADDLPGALVSTAKAYAISIPPAHAEVIEAGSRRAVLRFFAVYNFLDCHHVGVLEGVARACGVRVDVRLRLDSPHSGDIELTWGAPSSPPASR